MKLEILKNKSLIWSSVGVLILIVGIFVALQLIPQDQDIRQEAAIEGGPAEIRIAPGTITTAVGESKEATVTIDTSDININGLATVLTYNFDDYATPPVAVEGVTFLAPFNATPWNCSQRSETTGKKVRFEVNCNMTGTSAAYTTGGNFVPVFKFNTKGIAPTTTQVVFSFDPIETSISKVAAAGGNVQREILDTPTSVLRVSVTGAPAAEKKITVTTPSLSCSANDFTATAEVTEGSTKKAGVAVTFKYNNVTKAASTNDQGIATTTFTKASSALAVTAEAAGYTTGTATATPPTNCNGGGSSKTFDLSLSGLGCGASDFKAKAKVQGTDNIANVDVTFSYNGENKTAKTNSSGEAEVTFNRASSNKDVTVDAGGFEAEKETASLPSNCSTSSTGASCNQSCTATRDCASGLSCVSGSCRASQCSSDTSCGCADVDVAAQNGTTQLPQSGFDQTLALSILGLLFLLGGGQLLWSHKTASTATHEEN